MKVISRHSSAHNIEIAKLVGGLNGYGAIELKNWLFKNRRKTAIIIDLKCVRRIDGLGISSLEHFINCGIDIRLLNVGQEIRLMLKIAGKENVLKKIYNETDCNKAVSKKSKCFWLYNQRNQIS